MESKREDELLKEIQYLTNLIQSHGGQDSRNTNSGITSSVSSSHYHWNNQLTSCKNPSAVQNSKNVRTVFPRRPSMKTRKRLQKLGLSYHALEPFTPCRKKHSRKPSSTNTKTPVHHSNVVYINPSPVGTSSTQSSEVGVCGVESQTSVSAKVSLSPCSSAVKSVAQTSPTAKMAVPAMPTVGESQAQPGSCQNIKTLKKKKRRKSKLSNKCLPSRSQLTWRRKSLSSPSVQSNSTNSTVLNSNIPSTVFAGPSSVTTANKKPPSANSVYKWRRRSSSGSKSVPMSPLVSRSKFKMARASLLRKYNYIRHSPQMKTQQRQTHFPTARQRSSQKVRMKNHPAKFRSKSKNRVWIGSGAAAMDSEPKSAVRSMRLSLTSSPFSGVLAGRETKTRQGNKQWVSNRHLQLTQQSLRKAALLSSAKRASLVSLEKGSYVLDPSRRKLKKVESIVMMTPPSISSLKYCVTMEASVKRIRASHAVEKSRRYAWRAKNKSRKKSKQYCIFFNRFGKCNRGEKCTYIHDPDKIAVCTKYLKGLCDKTDGSCPLSHKISKEKMPVCSFFLRGVCIRENCPYLHVSVGKDADVCLDFAKGYCSKGEQCTKKHILDCPEFLNGGECPRGKQCPLRHRKRVVKSVYKGQQNTGVDVKQPRAFGNIQHRLSKQLTDREDNDHNQHGTYTSHELNFIPLELDSAPDFIAL